MSDLGPDRLNLSADAPVIALRGSLQRDLGGEVLGPQRSPDPGRGVARPELLAHHPRQSFQSPQASGISVCAGPAEEDLLQAALLGRRQRGNSPRMTLLSPRVGSLGEAALLPFVDSGPRDSETASELRSREMSAGANSGPSGGVPPAPSPDDKQGVRPLETFATLLSEVQRRSHDTTRYNGSTQIAVEWGTMAVRVYEPKTWQRHSLGRFPRNRESTTTVPPSSSC